MKQEMMAWQWHQLDHMQIICTLLQTDNHAIASSLNFCYRPDALPDAQPTVPMQCQVYCENEINNCNNRLASYCMLLHSVVLYHIVHSHNVNHTVTINRTI